MTPIPRAALLLGLAGLIPFLWGAATMFHPALMTWGNQTLLPRFSGPFVQLFYGSLILCFMSGVLWGFAVKGEGWTNYALSVLPLLYLFLFPGEGPTSNAVTLAMGFLGLLILDWHFWRLGLAPSWWMRLRLLLTSIVLLTLLPVIL